MLARWLGPWTASDACPPQRRRQIAVRADSAGDEEFPAYVYSPAGNPVGAYLIAPGVHHAGPDDPRSDRFCRVLAAAGALVMAPRIPSYVTMRVDPRAIADFERAFRAMRALPDLPATIKPRVFSISVGSLLALHLAAHPVHAGSIGRLVLFGGYGDWDAIMDFLVTGRVGGTFLPEADRLNQAVVFTNLIEHMEGAPSAAELADLHEAWRVFCRRTWSEGAMKHTGFAPVAAEVAQTLPQPLRRWFLVGCGVEAGNYEMCVDALARAGSKGHYLYPTRILSRIQCPVTLVHGLDDDVIPYSQSEFLAEALRHHVPVDLFLTGLYAHSNRAGARSRSPLALAREIRRLAGILVRLAPGPS